MFSLFPHSLVAKDRARGEADHHPIQPDKKDDDERERAVELLLVAEVEIDGKCPRGDEPGERRQETSERGIRRLALVRAKVGV